MKHTSSTICIVGTGYVGLVTAVGLAELGHTIIGVDNDEEKVNRLNSADPVIFEEGVADLLIQHTRSKKLTFSSDLIASAQQSDTIFLCLPTPQNAQGHADISRIIQVCDRLFEELADNSHRQIVIKSTVPIKTNSLLQKKAKNARSSFSIVSNPEFLRQGTALKDFLYPERVIIGARNEEDFKKMRYIYAQLLQKTCYFEFDPESVELIKYAANSFLATKISFMNEIATLCEEVGANIDSIKQGIGSDTRIGKHYLDAGIGYGGSCFPKDVQALIATGEQYGIHLKILDAAHQANTTIKKRFANKIIDYCKRNNITSIGVLGFAFKPNTDDIRESVPIEIIKMVTQEGIQVLAYDPQAIRHVKELHISQLRFAQNAQEVVANNKVVAVLTHWDDFLTKEMYDEYSHHHTVLFDARNSIDKEKLPRNTIFSVGKT